MRNLKTILAYDGSGYHGWQVQAGVNTVQETVEKILSAILKHDVRVVSSGRTDAGVHAIGQVINFFTPSSIPEEGLLKAMNSMLPGDIKVSHIEEVPPGFNARFTAKSKTYVYMIETSEVLSPFLTRYALHLPGRLDIDAMDISAKMLLGEHDFSSFMGAGSAVKTTIRRIMVSEVFTRDTKVYFLIKGSGFLRHMVRNIVGTLILIGQGRMEPGDMKGIISLKDRAFAGPTAPPQGLYLVGVEYDDLCRTKGKSKARQE